MYDQPRGGDAIDSRVDCDAAIGLRHAPRPEISVGPACDRTVVVRVRGALDIVGAADLRCVLLDVRDSGHDALADLGKVESIDSSAISILVGVHEAFTAAGQRLKLLRSLRPPVRDVLMRTPTRHLFVGLPQHRTAAQSSQDERRGISES